MDQKSNSKMSISNQFCPFELSIHQRILKKKKICHGLQKYLIARLCSTLIIKIFLEHISILLSFLNDLEDLRLA